MIVSSCTEATRNNKVATEVDSLATKAQQDTLPWKYDPYLTVQCSFMDSLEFVHGIAKEKLPVKIREFTFASDAILDSLIDMKKLPANRYRFAIVFNIEGCDYTYMQPIGETRDSIFSRAIPSDINNPTLAWLSCRFFERTTTQNNTPFFVIDSIELIE